MVLSVVVGCSNKSWNRRGSGFFVYLRLFQIKEQEQEELTIRRTNEWISAVSRGGRYKQESARE